MTPSVAAISASKQDHEARTFTDLERLYRRTERTDRERLAILAHILADEGHMSGLAGQLTARIGHNRFLTLPLGIGFEEATAADMLVVDEDLKVVEGNGMANPGARFHLWIYKNKPNVNSIVHTHPPATSALSASGQPLIIAHMDMCMFAGQCAYLEDWPGLPIGDEEGIIISEALGDKKTIFLANHGLIATGASIEEATYLAFFFERAAALQLRAAASGGVHAVDPEKAREAGNFLRNPKIVEMTFDYLARRVARSRQTGARFR